MKNSLFLSFSLLLSCFTCLQAQDLEDLMEKETKDETPDIVENTFKTTRLINGHSTENNAAGELDVKFGHRFGRLNEGAYNLFGLDNAFVRLALEYGLFEDLTIGFGRTSFNKTFDGFGKYRILKQNTDNSMPLSLSYFASVALNSQRWTEPERDNLFSSRLFYTHQLLIARKFNSNLSLQLMPTLVHRNLVETRDDANTVFSMGGGGRYKITPSTSINIEYYYLLPDQFSNERISNALSVGFDIETGGHVFQLFVSNSRGMIEKDFITETTGNWEDGDLHFGFNISRVFQLKKN